jgi:RNA polymerase sigma-70 factor (ECF subfamily)
MSPENDQSAGVAAEFAARRSYGKLVAFLAARTGDVAGAEDALSDAFAAALVEWPVSGVPRSAEAWLMTVARRKQLDATRRRRGREDAAGHVRLISEELQGMATADRPIPDQRLALMFACAHPAIDPGVRAPLILQTILGLDASTIASAFLVSPATMGQRLVRAKHKIRQAGIPFRVPERTELSERLDAVLAAIYAAFAEGWLDPAGTETRRRNLAGEALWLGYLVIELLPNEAEALGLLALMLHAEARRIARRSARGEYVKLAEQNTALWDARMIDEAEGLLMRASALGVVGRYQLEAAVQSAHANRRRTGRTDWAAIELLYDALFAITGSPVVTINRAIAIAETRSAEDALASLGAESQLNDYQPYWAARAELLARTGDAVAADAAYQRAIGLESDQAVREFLQRRRLMLGVGRDVHDAASC